jgi:hypothetical protein
MLVGGGLSLLLATVHWSGLVVGGVAVGLVSRSLPRALGAGLAFGLVVLAVFLASLQSAGTLDAALGMGQFTAIALLLPLVAGPLGALVHGIVPVEEPGTAAMESGHSIEGDRSASTGADDRSEPSVSEESSQSETPGEAVQDVPDDESTVPDEESTVPDGESRKGSTQGTGDRHE